MSGAAIIVSSPSEQLKTWLGIDPSGMSVSLSLYSRFREEAPRSVPQLSDLEQDDWALYNAIKHPGTDTLPTPGSGTGGGALSSHPVPLLAPPEMLHGLQRIADLITAQTSALQLASNEQIVCSDVGLARVGAVLEAVRVTVAQGYDCLDLRLDSTLAAIAVLQNELVAANRQAASAVLEARARNHRESIQSACALACALRASSLDLILAVFSATLLALAVLR
jgi:hypothetical protein